MFLFAGLIIAGIFLNIRDVTGLGANITGAIKTGLNNVGPNGSSLSGELVKNDIDSDGLPDEEEPLYRTDPLNPDTDGDGFLDGEEVAAGHDPTKPGPDDFLSTDNNPLSINITDKVSALMTGAFYAGDLSADADPEVYEKALADISVEILNDGVNALNPDNIQTNKTIFSSDSKEAQEKYLNAIGLIVQNIWGEIINEPRLATEKFVNFYSDDAQAVDDSRNYFNSKTDYYREVIAEVNALTVPPSWLDIHRQIISNLQTLTVSHQTLSQTAEDPLKGVFGMENLISVYQNIQPIIVTVTQKIRKNNLNPPNGELWSLIDSLIDGF